MNSTTHQMIPSPFSKIPRARVLATVMTCKENELIRTSPPRSPVGWLVSVLREAGHVPQREISRPRDRIGPHRKLINFNGSAAEEFHYDRLPLCCLINANQVNFLLIVEEKF